MDAKVSINTAAVAKSAEVSQNVDGSAKKLEMPVQSEGIKLPLVYNERLVEILHGFGLKASEENINILRLLYENGHPLTKENFFKMNHALKLAGSSDKALFLYENNIKLSVANLAMLDSIVSGKAKITGQLASLSEAISEIKNPEIKAKLTEVFTREKEALEVLLPKAQNGKQKPTGDIIPVNVEKLTAQAAAHHINIAHLGKFLPSNAESGVIGKQVVAESVTAAKDNPVISKDLKTIPMLQFSEIKAPLVKQVSYESIASGAKSQNQEVPKETPKPAEPVNQPNVQGEAVKNDKVMANIAAPKQVGFTAQTTQTVQAPASPGIGNLLFSPSESNPQEISRYIESLRIRLVEIIQMLRQSPDPASNRVVQIAREILNHIDFSSQIRNQIYVQLPYAMSEGQTDVSLYVFKDAKNAKASDGRGISSAFLSLETSSLGLFEAYVQKKDKSIHLQFRLKDEKIISYVRENIAELDILLGEYDMKLTSYGFTKNDEAFTVLEKPEKQSDEESTTISVTDEIPQFDKLV